MRVIFNSSAENMAALGTLLGGAILSALRVDDA